MIGDLLRTDRIHFWLLGNIADQISFFKVIVLWRQRERDLLIFEPCTLRFSHVLFVFKNVLMLLHESTLVKFCVVYIESFSEIGVTALIPSTRTASGISWSPLCFFALSWFTTLIFRGNNNRKASLLIEVLLDKLLWLQYVLVDQVPLESEPVLGDLSVWHCENYILGLDCPHKFLQLSVVGVTWIRHFLKKRVKD